MLATILVPVFAVAQNTFPQNGFAGIGTTNPQSALQIGDYYGNNQSKLSFPGVYNFELLRLGQDGNGAAMMEFVNHASLTKSYGIKMGTNVDTYGHGFCIVGAPPSDAHTTLQYSSQPAFFVSTENNVGIGTTQPYNYKLAVAGNMIAERVKVKLQGAWPDYVFSKHYILPSLRETEQFITRHGHLPDVPPRKS